MSFRFDLFLTLYFYGPLFKLFPKRKGIHIPILMYHSISDDPETCHPYFWINTSLSRFTEQMTFLHENGYTVISMSEAVGLIMRNQEPETPIKALTRNQQSGRRNIAVLTFDDGYKDLYTHALPILKQYGFTATVYLPTAFIESPKMGLKGKNHLNWEEVRELRTEGIEVGSHTVNHTQLHDLKWEIVEFEIKTSKKEIEDKIGREVKSFSYPFKFPEQNNNFISKFRMILQRAGYKNGVSTRIGIVHQEDDIFFLRRIPANSGDTVPLFRAKLEGNYDWLSFFQILSKKARDFMNLIS